MVQSIHVNKDKNILGVTINRGRTFPQYKHDINARLKCRLNGMKALYSLTSF